MKKLYLLLVFVGSFLPALAQKGLIEGRVVRAADGQAVAQADVFIQGTAISTTTNSAGYFRLPAQAYGKYAVAVFSLGLENGVQTVELNSPKATLSFQLKELEKMLEEVEVSDKQNLSQSIQRLKAVEGTAIYEAKKSEVIVLDALTANLATNNSRQIYSRVPGLNIWESDGAGLQLGIGGRGLSPNRTANFNTRQNGYDISADALGYPESYYSPPAEAIEKIQVVRGAASLQYGTQFGGMVNFVMRKGNPNKPLEFTTRQTLGSFGLFNSFNSLGGSKNIGKSKIDYYGYYQYKRGDGWRPNSGFDSHTAYADLNMQLNEKLFLCLEFTHMNYLAQQAGGLTDEQFASDPQQSNRERNWFSVNWNLPAVLLEYKFSDRSKLDIKTFGLISGRDALGNLERIDREDDPNLNRLLISDEFHNLGTEARFLQHYTIGGQHAVLLAGTRLYRGNTYKKQGDANASSGPDFYYRNADQLKSDHHFISDNQAVFLENIFSLSDQLSLTPGLRYEWIRTRADGYYEEVYKMMDENGLPIEYPVKNTDVLDRRREVFLAGLGLSYKPNERREWYANFSQNYRAITFSDLRTINPNFEVDPNLRDERGYSADLGIRGSNRLWQYDISGFLLHYNDKIGVVTEKRPGNIYKRVRRNVSDAATVGLEAFAELNLLEVFGRQTAERDNRLSWFTNISVLRGRYNNSAESAFQGNAIELAPTLNLKSGLSLQHGPWGGSLQLSYVSEQFTDATNAETTPNAVDGIIPAYHVADLGLSYEFRKYFSLEGGINNLTDARYFTRRAEAYPGPGIIPSDARSFYLTLQAKF